MEPPHAILAYFPHDLHLRVMSPVYMYAIKELKKSIMDL